MLVVGLTGGIGTGKSTFAALLAELGARVVDADRLGHEALSPGRPAWHSVVDQFGEESLVPVTMEIDRRRLAEVVFADPGALAALNAIVHPAIFKALADELESFRGSDEIVVVDAALIFETGLDSAMQRIIVVTSTVENRRRRLRGSRAMGLDDIDARMRSQMDPAELEARADIVVRNDGSLDHLQREAERVWGELQDLRRS